MIKYNISLDGESIGEMTSHEVETEEVEFEYYMRRGEYFYFRNVHENISLKIRVTDQISHGIISALSYGDTVTTNAFP